MQQIPTIYSVKPDGFFIGLIEIDYEKVLLIFFCLLHFSNKFLVS